MGNYEEPRYFVEHKEFLMYHIYMETALKDTRPPKYGKPKKINYSLSIN